MLNLLRCCVILGLDCNLSCRYCFRSSLDKFDLPTEMSSEFKEFISNLDRTSCTSLVVTGGEPLLYLDSVKRVFSLNDKIHKVIMTNGRLLTQELVDYINENNIELQLSNDGPNTEFLRGFDVFKDDNLTSLIREVKILKIVCVMTSFNNSVKDNYNYVADKLNREDFAMYFPAMQEYEENSYLIKDFDYDLYYRELKWYASHKRREMPYYYYYQVGHSFRYRSVSLDLRGNVISTITGKYLGTIKDSFSQLLSKLEEQEEVKFCNNSDCYLKGHCRIPKSIATPHTCGCAVIQGDIYNE